MLVRDIGIEAPRLRQDGSPVTQGMGREQMWQTMRIMGEFSTQDLAMEASTKTCTVEFSEAKTYIYFLGLAGYRVTLRAAIRDRPALYRFIRPRYTGPKPPEIQRKAGVGPQPQQDYVAQRR